MIKKHEDIMQALRADNYAPIYVLCGEEPYYTDKVFDFIAANALDEMAREFDLQIVYGRDLQGAAIGTSPAMARTRFPLKSTRASFSYISTTFPGKATHMISTYFIVIHFFGQFDAQRN